MTRNQIDKHEQYLYQEQEIMWTALKFHITHKNKRLTFDNRHFLKAIYLDKSPYMVVKKSTQCGISEYLVVRAMVKSNKGRSIFYVMPTWEIKNRFVKNRVDLSINNSVYYRDMLKGRSQKSAESASLKHIGAGAIAFTGSNSASSFTEFPADDLIIDELDRCNQENLAMAWERLSESKDKQIVKVSNPTIEDYGIDGEIKSTTNQIWKMRCVRCNKWIQPDFFRHVVREVDEGEYILKDTTWERNRGKDVKPICHLCHKPYDRKADGIWIEQNKRAKKIGYNVSKMFSTNVTVLELIERFEAGLKSDIHMQRFYNGDIGIAYTAKGSKITFDMLDECVHDYAMPSNIKDGVCVMGIDVGSVLHIKINQIMPEGCMRTVCIDTVPYSDDTDDIKTIKEYWNRYNCKMGVIDSGPEQRLARRLCSKIKRMWRWYHGNGKKDMINIDQKIITTDRNLLLDDVKEFIITERLLLPRNARQLAPITNKDVSEYYDNMTAATRTYDEGKEKYLWVESRPDHFMFAEGYALLARKLLKVAGK